jgi:ABC-type arginine/histidine transport system permease subunit
MAEPAGDATEGGAAAEIQEIDPYQAEVFRGAYAAVDRGQFEAARAVGMHRGLILRRPGPAAGVRRGP